MDRWCGPDDYVGEICALKKQDMADYAQETLEKVYRFVLPILRQRRYRVQKLTEFFPKNPNLLGINVNRGQRISLRLRRSHNPKEFLPFESVLGTMLHELCHNTFGPHDSRFFKLLDELTSQMDTLLAKGFRGDPFVGPGKTLAASNAVSWDSKNQRARSKPASVRAIGPGRKLGCLSDRGSPRNKRASLRELALEAAERRKQADFVCRTPVSCIDLTSDDFIDLTIDDSSQIEEKPSPRVTELKQQSIEPNELKPSEVICILD